ncbi:immunity 50 family protein [Bacillus altitudinis]|uniref:Immunity protein 50 n=1 Tax=Bacillus altitudinis TaxID=293387 RepID=A0A653U6D8_BACAB|nr:immunity 50 family protein [Bacillus altitudinis]MDM5163796.1 immunity 50 family protein [Bacillus altitudinis]QOV48558.1 immunity 50 family protein [Bacillus altitudinis]VXB89224.1 Immunity protein 50 [Bacillus altitudinis]
MIREEKFMNPQAMTQIFEEIPQFKNAEIMNVDLNRDGPTLFIRLMTKDSVKNKPKRWGNFDVVYVELSFIGVTDLKINHLGNNNIINHFEISTTENEGLLKINCKNQMQIETIFDWARVEQISPGLIGS